MDKVEIVNVCTDIRSSQQICYLASVFLAVFVLTFAARFPVTGQNVNAYLPAEKTSWYGFDRYDFILDMATLEITPFKLNRKAKEMK